PEILVNLTGDRIASGSKHLLGPLDGLLLKEPRHSCLFHAVEERAEEPFFLPEALEMMKHPAFGENGKSLAEKLPLAGLVQHTKGLPLVQGTGPGPALHPFIPVLNPGSQPQRVLQQAVILQPFFPAIAYARSEQYDAISLL